MSETLWGVIIGGVIALIGQVVTIIIPNLLSKRRNEKYTAIRIICILDKFVFDIIRLLNFSDLLESWPSDYPKLGEYPKNLKLELLDNQLSYEVFNLLNSIEEIEHYINIVVAECYGGDLEEYRYRVQEQYSIVGCKAYDIAEELRLKYGISSQDKIHQSWNNIKNLQYIKKKYEDKELEEKRMEEACNVQN